MEISQDKLLGLHINITKIIPIYEFNWHAFKGIYILYNIYNI